MSTPKEDAVSAPKNFVVANVDGRFLRFQGIEAVPQGADAITLDSVQALPKDKISELYSKIAGVDPKNFKDKKVAIDSLTYQVYKMPIFDPSAPKAEPPKTAAPGSDKRAANAVKKSNEMFELLSPPELEKVLKELAPQARELVLIMTELAKEKGSTKFSGKDLAEKLKDKSVSDRLKTRQDPGRILQYYKGKLIGVGLVRTS